MSWIVSIKQGLSFGIFGEVEVATTRYAYTEFGDYCSLFCSIKDVKQVLCPQLRGDVVREAAIVQWQVYVKECQVQLLPYQAHTVKRCMRFVVCLQTTVN